MSSFPKVYCLLAIFLTGLNYEIVLAQNRIVGGTETTIEMFPHMIRVQVGIKNSNLASICGGSIIGSEWGLAAAHCFGNPQIDYNKISVIAGTADIKNLAKTAKQHKVIKVVRSPYYNPNDDNRKVGGDIAVFKVTPPFAYSSAIQPIKLPQKGQPLITNYGTLSGWGKIRPSGPGSDKLLSVTVPLLELNKCKAKYLQSGIKFKEGEICYGFHEGTTTRDSCEGDSGGPLINYNRVQLGVVSYGVECGTTGFPGVYADVLYFRDWIKQETGI
ncbi:trypsin eta-like [Leptopilina heterotoma]|uniref:trypsin eta-like n=1 Tax=Leptopilina heterotoma TaxID=63436 RepID=UPI001CA8E6FD|nr:trypsin eta-like [Leptopilina heterotoma]